MDLDTELESMEATGETEAEQIDEETEIQDVEDDVDEILGEDALQSDLQHAYESFDSDSEMNYDGWDQGEVEQTEVSDEIADVLHSEGYSVEDAHDLEEELLEMEIEEGDIYAYLYDDEDNEIGFTLIDENGDEQSYFYVDIDDYEIVDDGSGDDVGTKVVRASDDEEFDLGITREGIAETTEDLNAVYKEGVEVLGEFKETMADISESFSFMKKRR